MKVTIITWSLSSVCEDSVAINLRFSSLSLSLESLDSLEFKFELTDHWPFFEFGIALVGFKLMVHKASSRIVALTMTLYTILSSFFGVDARLVQWLSRYFSCGYRMTVVRNSSTPSRCHGIWHRSGNYEGQRQQSPFCWRPNSYGWQVDMLHCHCALLWEHLPIINIYFW